MLAFQQVLKRFKRLRNEVMATPFRPFGRRLRDFMWHDLRGLGAITLAASILADKAEGAHIKGPILSLQHNPLAATRPYQFDGNRDQQAISWYALCRAVGERGCGDNGTDTAMNVIGPAVNMIGGEKDFVLEAFKNAVFWPLCNYLQDQVESGEHLLALLWRYKRWVEWFERDTLQATAGQAGWRESDLDRHLRRYLFEQGIDNPFSQPITPEGRADIVVRDPLWYETVAAPQPIEVKVFDGLKRNSETVRSGVDQAMQYARDFGSPVGILAVFNVSGQEAPVIGERQIYTAVPAVSGDRIIYCVNIQVTKIGPPSKRRSRPCP